MPHHTAMPHHLAQYNRIVVIGTSGAGKTTFAGALARALSRPHVELDHLHWGPDWTIRSDFAQRVDAATASEAWVVDGNYQTVRTLTWSRATAIVWLNLSFPVVFGRALWRTLRRIVTREVVAGGRERWSFLIARDGIPRWVLRTYSQRRREYPLLFARPEFRHLQVFEVRTPREAASLLATVERPR